MMPDCMRPLLQLLAVPSCLLVAACAPATYPLSGPSVVGVGNPAAGSPLTGAEVTARDGRTKHKWKSRAPA
jgi:hypothetical protein